MVNLILASKSKVRKEILDKYNLTNQVEPSNVDEEVIKNSLLKEGASSEIISKTLAELKANKVSQKKTDFLEGNFIFARNYFCLKTYIFYKTFF